MKNLKLIQKRWMPLWWVSGTHHPLVAIYGKYKKIKKPQTIPSCCGKPEKDCTCQKEKIDC